MNDPVMETLAKFQDDSQWEDIKYNVPIFVEHELWEVPHPFNDKETTRIAILPGQPKPKQGKMLYAIGAEDLTKIAQKINAKLNETGNAVKLFVGHTNNGLPQTQQPPLVGYGVGASVGPSGPKGRLAIRLAKLLHTKGSQHREFPERSPEFDPIKGEITGLALLKTDPKLPMGLVTYASEISVAGWQAEFKGTVAYAQEGGKFRYGKMTEEEGESKIAPERKPGMQQKQEPYKPLENPQQSDGGPDPTAPPTNVELYGEERMMADRFMKYYEQSHPAIRYMCEKYASEMQQAQEPLGTEPVPGPGDQSSVAPPEEGVSRNAPDSGAPDKKPAKPENPATEVKMASETPTVNYQAEFEAIKANQKTLEAKLTALEATNQSLSQNYAMEQSKRMLSEIVAEGYVIKDANKELVRMAKLDDAGRVDYAANIRENYAKKEMAPTGPMIGIFDEPVSLPGVKAKATTEEVDRVVRYSEKNKINLEDDGAFEKCLEAVRKAS